MNMTVGKEWWFTSMAVILPLLVGVIWWWNELWYALPVKARLRSSGKTLPPGHMGIPFIGELITFLWYFKIVRRPDDFINSKRLRYGDGVGMYRTYLFGSPTIIACSPGSSKFVLQADDAFCLPRWPSNDLVGHHSLLTAVGDSHKRQRNFVSMAVNQPKALRQIALLNQPRIAASPKAWAEKGTVNTYDEVKKMTFENIGKLFVSFEPGPLLDRLDHYFQGMLLGMRANPVNLPGTAYHYALQCRKKLKSIFKGELEKRKQQQRDGLAETRNDDLLNGLMQVKDENGEFLSDEEVVDNITSLVIGGYEATSLASTWAVYYLTKYPEVLQKLRDENVATRQKKNGNFITLDDISQMKYTKQVVEETVRIANVSPFVFRLGDKDVEYQGHVVPKGWRVICWLQYLHRDPRNFEDPMCFNPDRWDGPVKPGAFQAFGAGRKFCVGDKFARTQLAIFLHHLSTGYKWELENPNNSNIIHLPNPKPADGVKITISKL